MLHESNSFPGLAVKMLSKKTNTVLVGLKEAKENLSKAKNVVVTGTPTKIKKLHLNDMEKYFLKEKLGFNPDLPLVLVFGGSQGAKKINDALIEIIKARKEEKYQIVWAVGQKNYQEVKEELKKSQINIEKIQNVQILPYIYNMEEVMNVADLLVCRSGAITITEVAKLGKPAIFVPLPNVSQNHQEKNAQVLQKAGAAEIILNNYLTGEKLKTEIEQIITNKAKLVEMGENASKINIENVEDKIYAEIKKLIKK